MDLGRYSSIRIGGTAEVWVIETDEDALHMDGFLMGGAYNLLFAPNLPKLFMLGDSYTAVRLEGDTLFAGAAAVPARVASFAKKNDIDGFEFMSQLPGSVGGLLAMNAGVKEYETFDILKEIRFVDGWRKKENIEHGYRFANLGGVALQAAFHVKKGFSAQRQEELKKMRQNQPSEPSAGSCFKNPPGDYAGRLLEAVGLKGERMGSMAFSEKHANFLVNLGGGNYEDAICLIETAQKRVFESFCISLQLEIKIVGEG